MFDKKSQHHFEGDHFSDKSRAAWERVGSADGTLNLELTDFVRLKGDLPNDRGPRSSVFRIPPRPVAPNGEYFDTAIEIHLPAEELGALALRRWENIITADDARTLGGDILKGIACSERAFWDIPAILRGPQPSQSGQRLTEGFLSVTTSPDRPFNEGALSLLFYCRSESAPEAHAQIDLWLSEATRFIVHRGLPEALMAAVGEPGSYQERLDEQRIALPIPTRAVIEEDFQELLPESLMKPVPFHGRHPQLMFTPFQSHIRVPTHLELSLDFTERLNQSAVVQELSKNGFAVSFVGGVLDALPRRGFSEPTSLADLMPSFKELAASLEGPPAPIEDHAYWGPYLHILAEHAPTIDGRLDAIGGALLVIYRFRDHITGLEQT